MRPVRSTRNIPWLMLENSWNIDRAASSRMLWPSRGRLSSARMARLKHPKIAARDLQPMFAAGQRHPAVGPQAHLAELEQMLPAITEIHGRDQRQLDPVLTGPLGHDHPLQADHSRRRAAHAFRITAGFAP